MTDVLSIPMAPNDSGESTVGEYLGALLAQVWLYDEGFSGKRPFGNSSWKTEVYCALVKGGAVEGYEDNGYFYATDESAADALIQEAISGLLGNNIPT